MDNEWFCQQSGYHIPHLQDYRHHTWASLNVQYPNNNFDNNTIAPERQHQTVLINPHFKTASKVFVNPNFTRKPEHILNPVTNTKIYLNPNVNPSQGLMNPKTIHVNPKYKAAVPLVNEKTCILKENIKVPEVNKTIVLTKTKLIRVPHKEYVRKRRNSIKSTYKIVKSNCSVTTNTTTHGKSTDRSRFKLDNRRKSISQKPLNKFTHKSKFVLLSSLAKTRIIKNSHSSTKKGFRSIVNISGIMYKKSKHSLRRASGSPLKKKALIKSPVQKNKVSPRKAEGQNKIIKKYKIIRKENKKVAVKKLKKCNIPCPTYRKFGICKLNDVGKCCWKHDPDQIALCTKFLQGACINSNCPLSHKVLPEKMPTCKYFLEGSCSKENCVYLHVKISSKADVCRDFLEGFCKKAAECDKRHQYLCPEYEKTGACAKQRCLYPHGQMVRRYMINKQKFAKKCSDKSHKKKSVNCDDQKSCEQSIEKTRYYIDKEVEGSVKSQEQLNSFVSLQDRPRLGTLPAYISFTDSNV